MAPPYSPMAQHEASRHGLTRPSQTVNGLHLAQSRRQIRFSMNMRIVQPSSPCRGEAREMRPPSPCAYLTKTPFKLLFVSTTDPHSILLSSLSHRPIRHPPQGCGLTCHSWRRGFCLLGNVSIGCCFSNDVIPFYHQS